MVLVEMYCFVAQAVFTSTVVASAVTTPAGLTMEKAVVRLLKANVLWTVLCVAWPVSVPAIILRAAKKL
jgi:hypothetical protein